MKLRNLLSRNVQKATASVSQLQSEIRTIQQRISDVHDAPSTIEEAEQRIDRLIQAQQAELENRLAAMTTVVTRGRELNSYRNALVVPARRDPVVDETGGTRAADLLPSMSVFIPDQVKNVLMERARADIGKHGLTADERESRLADLQKQLHALEIREEQQIAALEEVDVWVPRREDCRPEIVLAA